MGVVSRLLRNSNSNSNSNNSPPLLYRSGNYGSPSGNNSRSNRKEILQLTLIGMAILYAGIYLFMFNKTIITMNKIYDLSNFYYYDNADTTSTTSSTTSPTTSPTTTTTSNSNNDSTSSSTISTAATSSTTAIITTAIIADGSSNSSNSSNSSSTSSTSISNSGNSNNDNNVHSNINSNSNSPMITIDKEYERKFKELELYRQIRNEKGYNIEWFIKNDDKLLQNADSFNIITNKSSSNINNNNNNNNNNNTNNSTSTTEEGISGPILDFVVGGFPKCGTTGVVDNLMHITPYGGGDVCTPPDSTVYYSYKNWVNAEKEDNPNSDIKLKFLRGTKCPKFLETIDDINSLSNKLPKTRLLVGIRHPVLWFQSFFNMQMSNFQGLYQNMSVHDVLPDANKKRSGWGCADKRLICVARSKFYLPLASLGKTPLDKKEIDFLLSNDYKNDNNILKTNQYIKNPILLYEQRQPSEDYFWNDVSQYLYINRSSLPQMKDVAYTSNSQNKSIAAGGNQNRTKEEIKKARKRKFNICIKERDPLRKLLMPISYNIYYWLMHYFIPAVKINENNDTYISNLPKFIELIESYQYDPCNRLIRNATDGTYYVPSELLDESATNISTATN